MKKSNAKKQDTLLKKYEKTSGNTVKNGIIYDSGGHRISNYSQNLAKTYLEITNEKPKPICPLLTDSLGYVHCKERQCAFWVSHAYTTENIQAGGRCAIVLLAEKNADGKIPV